MRKAPVAVALALAMLSAISVHSQGGAAARSVAMYAQMAAHITPNSDSCGGGGSGFC